MRVLVEEKEGKKVLSETVEKIMVKYPNVEKIKPQEEEKTHIPENNTEKQHSHQEIPERITENNTETQHSHPETITENSSKKRTKEAQKKPKKKPNTVTYVKRESPEEYKKNIRERIEKVLKIASAGGEPITYEMYETAVIQLPRRGSEVLLQRDICLLYTSPSPRDRG